VEKKCHLGQPRDASAQPQSPTGWKDDPNTLPWLKDRVRSEEGWYMRSAAVEELARGWKNDLDTLPILKDSVSVDPDGTACIREAESEERHRVVPGGPGGRWGSTHYRSQPGTGTRLPQ
jgi:hypothetical protein